VGHSAVLFCFSWGLLLGGKHSVVDVVIGVAAVAHMLMKIPFNLNKRVGAVLRLRLQECTGRGGKDW
jgi:hypothetical protein